MSTPNDAKSQAGPAVLIADDESKYCEQIRAVLEAASIDCRTVMSAKEAIDAAAATDLGVVVLDISLPTDSDVGVLEQLLSARPMLRVIVLSDHTEQVRVLPALRTGACDYLAKPLHEEELLLAVERARANFDEQMRAAVLRDRLAALESQLAHLAGTDSDTPIEQRAADAVAAVLGASKTSLMLLGEDGRELRVVAVTGRDLSPGEMDPVPVGQGVAGAAIASDTAMAIGNLGADARFESHAHNDRYRTQSLALAPVGDTGRPLGVLCATDRVDDRPFCEDDLSLLRILSLGIGRALGREGARTNGSEPDVGSIPAGVSAAGSEPMSEGDRSDAELARRICDALTAEIDPARLVAAVLRAVAESVKAAPVSMYLLDATGRELRLEAQCELSSHADHGLLPANQGLTGAVCQTGHLIATDTPEDDPRFDPIIDAPEGSPARPLLCLPLVVRNKTLGVVRVFPQQGVSASARTGEILTAAISAAVRNVLMYRSLLESVDEVAKARRQAQHAGNPVQH